MSNKNRLKFAIIACAGWFPVAIFSIFIKKENIQLRFFPLFYKFSAIGDHPSLRDQLFIYRDDILFSFIIIPALIIFIVYFFPRKKTLFFLSIISLGLLVLLFANMHSWGTVGKPLSHTAFIDAAVFALQSPKFISMYVDAGSWMKFSILICASLSGYLFARKIASVKYLNYLAVIGVVAVFLTASVALAFGMQSKMKDSEVFQNFILLSISSFIDREDQSNNSLMSTDDAMMAFKQLTNTPDDSQKQSPYFAKAKGNDLIVYIIETGPVAFFDFDKDIDSFPAIRSLTRHSLLSYNHYSTYPGSAQALFSLFFSVYPPQNYYQSCITHKEKWDKPFPGFISKLKEAGYSTNLYLPYHDTIPLDKLLHKNLGVDNIVLGEDYKIPDAIFDVMALEKMKKDIINFIDKKQPYVAVFMPQVGHAPWKDRSDSVSIKEYGRKLGILQDGWIAGIIELLKKKGKLETTTIVITADHGIRTAKEDPDFNMGFIDDYSFHVPLVLYSQSAFTEPLIIKKKTSHIDISPSLIDLFGLSPRGLVQQGLSMWDSGIGKRDIFYLGDWGFDADGFYENNSYYMYNDIIDMCFINNKLSFSPKNIIKDENRSLYVKNKISSIYTIQENIFSNYFCRE